MGNGNERQEYFESKQKKKYRKKYRKRVKFREIKGVQ